MNVLIVDDDAQYRLLMRNILLAEGWDVFLANDGLEAMEKIKSVRMDFLISDVYMPLMDGIKFHKTVRMLPEYERVPFLFISGYDDELTRNCIKDPRIERFYRKARPLTELRELITYLTVPEKRTVPPPHEGPLL